MFKRKSVDQIQSALASQGLEFHHLVNRIDTLEASLHSLTAEVDDLRKASRKDYDQLSTWDDHRREEIRKLATAAGLEIHRGTHLVAVEDEE